MIDRNADNGIGGKMTSVHQAFVRSVEPDPAKRRKWDRMLTHGGRRKAGVFSSMSDVGKLYCGRIADCRDGANKRRLLPFHATIDQRASIESAGAGSLGGGDYSLN